MYISVMMLLPSLLLLPLFDDDDNNEFAVGAVANVAEPSFMPLF